MLHWRFYVQGWLLEMLGQRQAAIVAYRAALGAEAGFGRARNRLAFTLASLERYDEAEPHFKAVLDADPGNAVAYFNLGFTYDRRGRYAEAAAQFRQAARLNPGLDRAWYGLGLACAHLGQHGEAVAALREAATLQPMNPHAWYALGMAHHAHHEPDKVREVALHLVRFDPKMARRLIRDAERADLAYLVADLLV